MTKTLILMQGIPGSGKSTVARGIAAQAQGQVTIRSTDDFWGEDYNFEPQNLGLAHDWNQLRVESDMETGVNTIIVDNTNIKARDVAVYKELAQHFGYSLQVIRVVVPLTVALDRNAERTPNRRVPDDVIRRMYVSMQDLHFDTKIIAAE